MKKVVQKPLKNGPKIIKNHEKRHPNTHAKKNTKNNMIFIKKVLKNGAKRPPLERIISPMPPPWTPQGTKHVERRPRDTKISEKVTSKLQKFMKKRSQEIIFQSKSDQPEQPAPPNQTDPPDQPDQPDLARPTRPTKPTSPTLH